MKTSNPLPADFSLYHGRHPLSSRPFFRPRRANRDHVIGKANTATKFIMTGQTSPSTLGKPLTRPPWTRRATFRHYEPSQPNRSPVHFRLRSRWQIRPCLRTIPWRRTRTGGTERRKRGIPLCLALQNVKAFAKLPSRGKRFGKICSHGQRSHRKGEDGPEAVRFKGKAVHAGSGCISAHQFCIPRRRGLPPRRRIRFEPVSTGTTRMPIGPSSADGKGEGKLRPSWHLDRSSKGKKQRIAICDRAHHPSSSWKWTGNTPKPSRATVCRQTWILGRICYWSPNCTPASPCSTRRTTLSPNWGTRRAW